MVRYRFYTENRTREHEKNIHEVLRQHGVQGYTLFPAVGYWEGQAEPSCVIEILQDKEDGSLVENLAQGIRIANNQQSVLVTTENTIEGRLI